MGRVKDAIIATGEPDALTDFQRIAAAVRDCFNDGEDVESAVVKRLTEDGMPAAMLAEGTRWRDLVVQLARGLQTSLLSFGLIRCEALTFQHQPAPQSALD